MTGRKCSNCKHYEPAPIWRKGWCRNALLYAPQQNHLVGEDDLDCERGMGNYWEPGATLLDSGDPLVERVPQVQPLHLYPGSVPPKGPTPMSPSMIYTVSGSSGYGVDPDDDLPPPAQGNRITTPGGRERELSYYSDERYWTDYLRIALPIVGVILILLLFWFWVSAFLGDNNDDTLGAGADATGTQPTLPMVGASPATTERVGAGNTPIVVVTPTGQTGVNPPAGQTPPGQAPVTGGEILVGSTVQVTGTGADGANLRAESSTESTVVDVLLDGTQLAVIGGPFEDGTYTWWNVQNDAVSGWLVADFLEVIQQ